MPVGIESWSFPRARTYYKMIEHKHAGYLFSHFSVHFTKGSVLNFLSIYMYLEKMYISVQLWSEQRRCTFLYNFDLLNASLPSLILFLIVPASSFCFLNSAGKKLNKNKNTCKIYFASSWHLNRKRHDFIIWYEVLDPYVLVNIGHNGRDELRYKEFTSKNGTNCLLTAFNLIS